jgi:hypothetical protein
VRDKLIIIATIQNVLQAIQLLIHGPKGPRTLGALTAMGTVLLNIHYLISGSEWQGTPRELEQWMLKYIKDEAEKLGNRSIVTIN